jgi:hypothetical protein
MIVYSHAADYEVLASFKKAGIARYTKMEQAQGEGEDSEPKLGTHIWPGKNNVLFLAVSGDESETVREVVETLKKHLPRAGVRAFLLPMDEMV